MDNQQGKDLSLAWLAGLLDGEAAFFLIFQKQWREGKQFSPTGETGGYIPCVKIGMCDGPTLVRVSDVLERIPVGHYGPYYTKPKGTRRAVWDLKVVGLKRCLTLFKALGPYSVTKARQISLLREFCELRLATPHMAPYSDREREIIEIFRDPDHPQRPNARPDNRRRQMTAVG